MNRIPLKWQILVLFCLLFLGANLFTFVLVRRVTGIRYTRYVKTSDQEQAQAMAEILSGNLQEQGELNLNPMQRPMMGTGRGQPMMGMGNRVDHMGPDFFLLDENKKVIYSARPGSVPLSDKVDLSAPIITDGNVRGYVLIGSMAGPALAEGDQLLLNQLNRIYIFTSVSFTLLGLLMALMIINRLFNPLEKIQQATRKLAEGDYTVRVGIKGDDEIARLALSFDSMAHSLDKSRRWKEQLISDTAHELRTPVSLILGNLEMIRDGIYQPSEEKLEQLHREAESLTRLISDMQTLSSLEGDLPEIEKEDIQSAAFLEEIQQGFAPLLKEKNLQLRLEIPDPCPLVMADPLRLRQVFKNLLSNGLRYSPDEGEMLLSCNVFKDRLEFHLEDQGPGIPESEKKHIFERFYRIDDSRNKEEGGRGLGLAISKAIVEAMGGSMAAGDSRWGGADIWFYLPLL